MKPLLASAILGGLALAACDAKEPASTTAAPVVAAREAPAAAVPSGWSSVTEPALGISFAIAPGRHTGPCPDVEQGVANCVALFEGETHLISFQTHVGPLAEVAAAEAGFEPDEKGVLMTTYGRFEPVPVETFASDGWSGQKAVITCGISDENGFHAAAGDCLWAVVGDGRRAVVANTQGLNGLDPDTLASLMSLRFLPGA